MRDECYVEKVRLEENQDNSRAYVQYSVWLSNPKNRVLKSRELTFSIEQLSFMVGKWRSHQFRS